MDEKQKQQKEQINRILDLEQKINDRNDREAVLLNLTDSDSLLDPTGMTKDQFLELNNVDVRRRNGSTSSGESTEFTKPLFGNKEIIYRELVENDTLQTLALNYNCKVSEIKHANKLYQENELFALRTIKIPVVKDGTLHCEYLKQQEGDPSVEKTNPLKEQLDNKFYGNRKDLFRAQTEHQINPDLDFLQTSDDDEDLFNRTCDKTPLLSLPPRTNGREKTITIGQPIDNEEPTLSDFIQRVDIRIQHEIKNVNSQKEDMGRVVDTLLSPVVFPPDQKETTEIYGTACYCSWKFWLAILCVVALVVPLLYFLHFHK